MRSHPKYTSLVWLAWLGGILCFPAAPCRADTEIVLKNAFVEQYKDRVTTYGHWPAGMKHFVKAKGETVLQFHGTGPWSIQYVNPADDPRNKK